MSAAVGAPALRARRRRREGGLRAALTLLAGSLAVVYGGCLMYLLLRGGWKALAVSYYAMPKVGVQGEDVARFLLAALYYGGLASLVLRVAVGVVQRAAPALSLPRHTLRNATLGVALLGALFARDHLPRFLLFLPSEVRAGGGVGPQIFNTLYLAVLSTAVTLPLGLGAALYVARFARSGPFVAALRTALDTLASLPSIVYGLFGFLVFVVELRAGYSLFGGALVLALLNLPVVVGIAEESLRAVPREMEEASLALGATPVQTAFRVTLPYAWPGILSALVLSVGRVFAESAPLIMTAGTTISRGSAYSFDPFRGGETLAVHLWYVNSAGLSPDKGDVSAGTAAVLVLLIVVTNGAAARLARLGGPSGPRARRILQA